MMTLYPVRYIQHLCYLFDSNCTINYDNSVPIFPPSLPLIQEDHFLKPVQFYDVSPWTEEGRLISQKFHQTLCVPHYCIVRVFKIHNPVLWQQYVQRKYQLFYELGGMAAAEQRLFHGTYQANLTGIATKGFDWKSGKKHGKLLGYGTYFAKDARCAHEFTDCGGNYCSARWDDPCCKKLDTGSSLCQQFQPLMVSNLPGTEKSPFPNCNQPLSTNSHDHDVVKCKVQNTHFMIIARVMIGRYCKGWNEMPRPPSFEDDSPYFKMFDTSVDNVESPQRFCIFENHQAYPEFIIEYRTNS